MAEDDGEAVGHVAYSVARLDDGADVLALAPMGVLPDRQGEGVGAALARESLKRAAETAFPVVVVLGHPEYYPRFGFAPAARHGIECPYDGVPPDAWLVHRLPAYRGDVRGTVVYPAAFGAPG